MCLFKCFCSSPHKVKMAAAMVVDPCGDEEAGLYMCSTCENKVELGNSIVVNAAGVARNEADRRRCRKCHNMLSRLQRCVKSLTEEQQVGYRAMSPQGRKELYKRAQLLCGSNLNKELTEAIHWSDIQRETTPSNEEGTFKPQAEVIAEWTEKRPEMLKELLEKAPSMECKYTGATLIMVPSYSVKRSNEQLLETRKVQKLESRRTVKKIKVQKETKDEPDDENKENREGEPSDQPAMGKPEKVPKGAVIKPATEGQLGRLTKLAAKLEEIKLNCAQAALQVETQGATEWIPDKLTAKIDAYKCKLDIALATAEKLMDEKQFSADAFKALLEDCEDVGAPLQACLDHMATLVLLGTEG